MSKIFKNKSFSTSKNDVTPRTVIATQSNTFNSVFDPKPLDELEQRSIEKLLVEGYRPGFIKEEKVEEDIRKLKSLTAEIKAIGRQGIVLMGERVHKAREMLKLYQDGTFTKWLDSTFGTRKTGYNALSYFELYKSLPDEETRRNLKKLPLRAAYVLASRQGDATKKLEILRGLHNKSHGELLTIIQDLFPLDKGDKRKKEIPIRVLLNHLKQTVKDLEKAKKRIKNKDREFLNHIGKTLIKI